MSPQDRPCQTEQYFNEKNEPKNVILLQLLAQDIIRATMSARLDDPIARNTQAKGERIRAYEQTIKAENAHLFGCPLEEQKTFIESGEAERRVRENLEFLADYIEQFPEMKEIVELRANQIREILTTPQATIATNEIDKQSTLNNKEKGRPH